VHHLDLEHQGLQQNFFRKHHPFLLTQGDQLVLSVQLFQVDQRDQLYRGHQQNLEHQQDQQDLGHHHDLEPLVDLVVLVDRIDHLIVGEGIHQKPHNHSCQVRLEARGAKEGVVTFHPMQLEFVLVLLGLECR